LAGRSEFYLPARSPLPLALSSNREWAGGAVKGYRASSRSTLLAGVQTSVCLPGDLTSRLKPALRQAHHRSAIRTRELALSRPAKDSAIQLGLQQIFGVALLLQQHEGVELLARLVPLDAAPLEGAIFGEVEPAAGFQHHFIHPVRQLPQPVPV